MAVNMLEPVAMSVMAVSLCDSVANDLRVRGGGGKSIKKAVAARAHARARKDVRQTLGRAAADTDMVKQHLTELGAVEGRTAVRVRTRRPLPRCSLPHLSAPPLPSFCPAVASLPLPNLTCVRSLVGCPAPAGSRQGNCKRVHSRRRRKARPRFPARAYVNLTLFGRERRRALASSSFWREAEVDGVWAQAQRRL